MSLYHEQDFDSTQQQFIINYLNSIWNNVRKKNINSIFFNIEAEEFEEGFPRYIKEFKDECLILEEEIDNNYNPPYQPFLKFIAEYLQDYSPLEIEKYIEETDIYQLHKPLFIDFFNSKQAQRKEEIILEEFKYEQQQMLRSIIKLLIKLTEEQGPVLIVIKNLEQSSASTLNIIQHIIKKDYQVQLMFLVSFDKRYRVLMSGGRKKKWDQFIKTVERENMIINLNQQEELKQGLSNEEEENLVGEELIELGSHCFSFLALDEAKKYLEEVYNYYQQQNLNLDSDNYIKLLNKLGDTYNYLNEDNNALLIYQALADYLKTKNRSKELATAYRKSAVVHFKKYNLETAEDLIDKSLKLAQNDGTEQQLFLIYFLICLIQERKKEYSPKQWQELYNKTVSLGKKLELYNTLACFYTHFHYIYYIEVVEQNNQEAMKNLQELVDENKNAKDNNNRLMEDTYYKEVLRIAQDYDNQYRLAAAYQLKAVIYGGKGDKEQVLKYYKKSEKIKEELDIKRELAYIYNGLGHHYFTCENYEQAYDYHNQALQCLREVKDYHEIAVTCLNQGLNLYFAGEHQLSIIYLTELLEILRVLQLEILMYQSQGKLYSLLGINYLKIGNFAKAEECMLKLKFEGVDKSSGDILEPFFVELFTALYYKSRGDYQLAKKYFSKALVLLNNINYDVEYIYPHFYYEYGLMYKKIDQPKRAEKVLKLGLEYCEKLDYNFYKKLILQQLGIEKEIDEFYFEEVKFDFDWIAESAELEETLNKFHNQMSRVKFLNRVQDMLVKIEEKEELINKIMKLIEYNFLAEYSNLFLKEDGEWENYFASEQKFVQKIEVEKLIAKMTAAGEEKLVDGRKDNCEIKDLVGDFNTLIFIPLKIKDEIIACLFCFTVSGDLELTVDDLQILSILGQQLANALEKIAKDVELKEAYEELQDSYSKVLKLSKTDFLTGLYNRFELIKKLNQEKSRIERYQNYDPNYYSVMYIDLDNFKYYNDHFGHDIGDLVLCKFAELLEHGTRDVDFVSRFGGDEFVVALPETKAVCSYNVAKRIQSRLVEVEQFKVDIEEKLGEEINIAPEKRLTCSIGIAENDPDNHLSNDQLLKRADQVLYTAKEEGKNQIKIWMN
ncbi:diguanylate cyclase [Halanaerobacter jeridensis]|uniref:Diguanylate cyclase (GGDEF)-like protein n=1 Tax=Halanaerobacter jeridensis TaxID=706427 RepID=A0A938XPR8_9FIRM|nr:diguanylate cyclase [Halanaerobacter jeridensis]MBM7557443.1 diguanylate cyclase (GGDEF)-like protein [Halanaerobacter jeridensis]